MALSQRGESYRRIFREDEPGSRRAYRSGISSEHDSSSLLAWAVPRAGEKPAGGRAVMATTESRGAVEAEILPPCHRDTGQLCLRSFPARGRGEKGGRAEKAELKAESVENGLHIGRRRYDRKRVRWRDRGKMGPNESVD